MTGVMKEEEEVLSSEHFLHCSAAFADSAPVLLQTTDWSARRSAGSRELLRYVEKRLASW